MLNKFIDIIIKEAAGEKQLPSLTMCNQGKKAFKRWMDKFDNVETRNAINIHEITNFEFTHKEPRGETSCASISFLSIAFDVKRVLTLIHRNTSGNIVTYVLYTSSQNALNVYETIYETTLQQFITSTNIANDFVEFDTIMRHVGSRVLPPWLQEQHMFGEVDESMKVDNTTFQLLREWIRKFASDDVIQEMAKSKHVLSSHHRESKPIIKSVDIDSALDDPDSHAYLVVKYSFLDVDSRRYTNNLDIIHFIIATKNYTIYAKADDNMWAYYNLSEEKFKMVTRISNNIHEFFELVRATGRLL